MSIWRQVARNALSGVGMLSLVRQYFGRNADGSYPSVSAAPLQQDIGGQACLVAVEGDLALAYVGTLSDYQAHASKSRDVYQQRWAQELQLADSGTPFTTPGYCYVCDCEVEFQTDFLYSTAVVNGKPIPNWRERVLCSNCQLNNRIRASIHLLEKSLGAKRGAQIYLAEQITPLHHELKRRFPALIGSEYLGEKIAYGACDERGIRNESITKLTFRDNAFDYILNFDVLEHVPDVSAALREIHRTLSPGGTLLLSVPFMMNEQTTRKRSIVDESGNIKHILEPQYHGDPIADAGCLCFHDFGWDFLDQMRETGFVDVNILLYWSGKFGYYGVEQIMITGKKSHANC